MTKYVALLRGINVGGKKKVEMKQLRVVFEALGLENVQTYINSGNVIFETKKASNSLVKKIEAALAEKFGFEILVVLRDQKNIEQLVAKIPSKWSNDTEQKTDVLFVWPEFDGLESLKLLAPVKGIDDLLYMPGAIVWHIKRKDYNKSAMHKFIGTAIYKKMTARNVNTVRKLATLMAK